MISSNTTSHLVSRVAQAGLAFALTLGAAAMAAGPSPSAQQNASATSSPATATGTPPAQQADMQKMLAKLRQLQPGTQFDSVAPAPNMPGLYEVTMGRNIVYVEPSGRYWLMGHIMDMRTLQDLTADRMADLDKVDFAKLPQDLAIKFVHGKPLKTVAVFADPNCGYCKQLEREIALLKDTQVLLYPVPILGQDSAGKIAAIWCSNDRASAWYSWMTKAAIPQPPTAACAAQAPIDRLMELAKAVHVDGTPTLIAADGRKHSGSLSAPALQAWLNKAPDGSAQTITTGQADAPRLQ